MHNVEVFISNGRDTNRYRDVGANVVTHLRQLLQHELNYDVTISYWDYRIALPTVVPAGALATTSLRMVDCSHGLVAIFGRRVPRITTDEIRRAFQRRRDGDIVDVFVFANPRLLTPRHEAFVDEILATYGEQIVWAPYTNALTFPDFRHVGIDLFLTERAQGRGFGPEALRTLARYLIDERGHHRLTIDPAADNTAAIRAFESVGFRTVGVMREYWRTPDGTWRDGLLMDLLARELDS